MTWFNEQTPQYLAKRELEEAMRSLLVAQSGQEYANVMVLYHQARINRLGDFLKEAAK